MKRCCKPSKFLMVSFRKLQHVVGLMSKFGPEDMLSALGFILLRALGHLFMHQQHLNGWVHSSFSSPVHSLIPQTNRNFKVGHEEPYESHLLQYHFLVSCTNCTSQGLIHRSKSKEPLHHRFISQAKEPARHREAT